MLLALLAIKPVRNTLINNDYQLRRLIVTYLFQRNGMHSRFITHVINTDFMKNLQASLVGEFGIKLVIALVTWSLIVITIFAEQ
jgi:hypothetical protein